jgi:hypothetical protein
MRSVDLVHRAILERPGELEEVDAVFHLVTVEIDALVTFLGKETAPEIEFEFCRTRSGLDKLQ